MNQVREKLFSCLESLKKKTDFKPEVALVLGSGLGDYAEHIEVKETVDYKDLEGFPVSTVAGVIMSIVYFIYLNRKVARN